MASGNLVLEQIVLHQANKMRLDTGRELTGSTFLKAKLMGMLVQLARPSPEARLLALRSARHRTAAQGRHVMRELRQLQYLLKESSRERYLRVRDEIGGSQWTGPRPAFGESYQEMERDIDEVTAANISHALVLSRMSDGGASDEEEGVFCEACDAYYRQGVVAWYTEPFMHNGRTLYSACALCRRDLNLQDRPVDHW